MKEKLQFLTIVMIIIFSTIVISISGCGKKAPPIPPAEKLNIEE